jgi:hypothetical protein
MFDIHDVSGVFLHPRLQMIECHIESFVYTFLN